MPASSLSAPIAARATAAQRHAGVDRDAEPQLGQALGRDLGRAPAGYHVQQQRRVYLPCDPLDLLDALGRLDEDDVSAGLGVGTAAGDGLLDAEWSASVGAGDDDRVGVRAGLERGPQRDLKRAASMTSLPARWPQRLGKTWSSSWIAATPARSYSTTVRTTLIGRAIAGVCVGDDRHVEEPRENAARSAISLSVNSPTSGSP